MEESTPEAGAGSGGAERLSNLFGKIRSRVSVGRIVGKLLPNSAEEPSSGLDADERAYCEIVEEKVRHGCRISRYLEEKKPPSIKHEETDVVHRVANEEHPGVEYDIPEDSYGAAILAIIKEVQEFDSSGRHSRRIRLGYALVLLTLNLMLQVGILMFIDSHVVRPAVHNIQMIFKNYHATFFDDTGRFRPERWQSYSTKQKLCQLGASSRFFFCVVLFVWVTAIQREFRTTYYMTRNINRMPRCSHSSQMMIVTRQNVCIVALTLRTRWLLYALVCAPKFLISLYLLSLGCQWLSASTSFEGLVLNAVAMEFVLHIDELLYKAFVPATYRRQVADINFFVRQPRKTGEEEQRNALRSYALSMLYLVGALSFMGFYITFIEDSLPPDIGDLQAHCRQYVREIESMICQGWGWSDQVTSCYPFGNGSRPSSMAQADHVTGIARSASRGRR